MSQANNGEQLYTAQQDQQVKAENTENQGEKQEQTQAQPEVLVADSEVVVENNNESPFVEGEVLTEEQNKIIELEKQIRQLQSELSTAKDQSNQYLKAYAEIDNKLKRIEKKTEEDKKFSIEKFARELLSVKDSLEAGLGDQSEDVEKVREGMDITLRQLTQALEKHSVKEVNPVGEKFDPNLHQAMSMLPSDEPANTVIQVLQKGYALFDRVLRPAMVIVAKAKD